MKNRIFALVLAILTVLACMFVTSCTQDEKTGNSATGAGENDKNEQQSFDNLPDVTTLDGTPMVSNTKYSMARSGMVFAVPTAYSKTAGEGITLVATAEPSYAVNKEVDWHVSFLNEDSVWANGKNATDYITVTPTEDGSLTATVECKEAFAEKIVITVVSRANPNIKDTCTVDYARRVEGVSIKIGDDITLTPGDNYVPFEVATGNTGVGGDITFEVDFSDIYTIDSLGNMSTDLNEWGCGAFEIIDVLEGVNSEGVRYKAEPMYDELNNVMSITFDVDTLRDVINYQLHQVGTASTYVGINEFEPSELIQIIESGRENGKDTIFTLYVVRPDNYRYAFNVKFGDLINSGSEINSLELNEVNYIFNSEV